MRNTRNKTIKQQQSFNLHSAHILASDMADKKAWRRAFRIGPPGAMNRAHSSHVCPACIWRRIQGLITTEEIMCGSWRFLEGLYVGNMWQRSCNSVFSWCNRSYRQIQEWGGSKEPGILFQVLVLKPHVSPFMELGVWRLLSDLWPQRLTVCL